MKPQLKALVSRPGAAPQLAGATRERTILDDPHHRSLELVAARALAEGDWATAFRLADRRCRIAPAPEPLNYALRAQAAYQMGERAAALGDLAKALELAPEDIVANRKMLVWATGAGRSGAARALIDVEADADILRKAIKIVLADGHRAAVRATALDSRIEGWAVWRDAAPLEVAIADDAGRTAALFEPDPRHPFSDLGHAAAFVLARPRSPAPQSVTLAVAGRMLHFLRLPANEARARGRAAPPVSSASEAPPTTVIVPVHGDFDATCACLDSLLAALDDSPRHCALIVDDAAPDPRVGAYLARLRGRPRIALLSNRMNLGFVGSINRALAQISDGDVILLNADTIVPPGFIDRLAAAAASSPDIGAVTPLSNHGEFTSFPKPNAFNQLESPGEIRRIDGAAAGRNRGRVVDIPSGVGFCLYVTRACLDAVGGLCEDFHRGYLEDVDFCLRARAHGFRSVCAASVYVGHAGSKSFGHEKRALVVRNLKILERRFPGHRAECAAFMLADPLRTARQSIERALPEAAARPRLLITGAGVIGEVALARAHQLAAQRRSAIILEARWDAGGSHVRMFNPAGGSPQSVQFDLASSRERAALIAYAHALRPTRMEFLDPGGLPASLVNQLLELKIPHDLFIADAGLLAQRGGPVAAIAQRRAGARAAPAPGAASWRPAWRAIADAAGHILAPCAEAQAFAASILPERQVLRLDRRARGQRPAIRSGDGGEPPRLGIVAVRSDAQEQRQIAQIARALRRRRPDVSIVVVGATLDDFALMRTGDVFVTGRVERTEFDDLVRIGRIGALFLNLNRPLFGHPIVSQARKARTPVAYRDWSAGGLEPRPGDLPIDPRAGAEAIAGDLCQWMARR